ncbi:MAG: ImmA/IrrE family metallo-endopeptidase [Selenomonadaceae bacterium]|nr:ImmA/IrrE family metallo-endopeptidase [Selenomonadaceae bacterium]MBP3723678.1 ImmA/IrrE family metallo-endopeptidase [Selenomonadaceae bacterium]
MELSHIEIQNLAEEILLKADIEPCYKPSVTKIVAAAGLRVAPALNLAPSVYSRLKITNRDGEFDTSLESIAVNASKDAKEQRFATVYQVAFYLLFKDVDGIHESYLNSMDIDVHSDAMRLACAILMNEELFVEKFHKALKGIPNLVAVTKNLATAFFVPPFAVKHRAQDLNLNM